MQDRDQRIEAIRMWADENNSFCVFASLCELSFLLNPRSQIFGPEEALIQFERLFGKEKSKAVSPKEFFHILQAYSVPLGISTAKVTANPSFIDKFEVPAYIQDKLLIVSGYHKVDTPNMRVLAKKKRGEWITHAETDDGSERLRARIEPMLHRNWHTGMVINFNRS